jgi:hypothetical protein
MSILTDSRGQFCRLRALSLQIPERAQGREVQGLGLKKCVCGLGFRVVCVCVCVCRRTRESDFIENQKQTEEGGAEVEGDTYIRMCMYIFKL